MAIKASLSFLSPEEALTVLRQAGEVHKGKRKLPPEIVKKRKEIEEAIRNAELFLLRLRVVDEGMVNHAVQLKFELDALYGAWAKRETKTKYTLH